MSAFWKFRSPNRAFALATYAPLLLFLLGCSATKQLTDPIIGPSYAPSNVYRRAEILPLTLNRVAILPLSCDQANASSLSGQQLLEPVLHEEFGKSRRFEIAVVRPEQLKQWTGKTEWNFQEALPPEFLQQVQKNTAADGILFAHLSRYHPYPPMVIGWRVHLVGANQGDVIWSVDEVFDAGESSVSNAARWYSREHLRNHPTLEDSRSILLSPSRFGQYTVSAIVSTLPRR